MPILITGGIIMALKNAPFCTRCGQHRTKNPSGLCSHCRRRPHPELPCKRCGTTNTSHESGLCYRCRCHSLCSPSLPSAIETQRKILTVLEMRQANYSFGNIGKALGMSKSGVYSIYRSALHLPNWANNTEGKLE